MVFSERYKDLIHTGDGMPTDNICGDIEFKVRTKIADVCLKFYEPTIIQPDRYNNFTENTSAIELAIDELSDIYDYRLFDLSNPMMGYMGQSPSQSIAAQPVPVIFDLIELQYKNLSDGEKEPFRKELNDTFNTFDIPWLLVDGRMIKIDAQQFECDLKAKALENMRLLKDANPIFQSAYIELMTAIEALEKTDYQSAISNAGKSYESVLKVILSENKGNADKLTSQYMNNFLIVPETMGKSGFREKVLMSLPFIRNNSGADHGAGSTEVVITKSMAELAVNLAASLNTFLIEEYKNEESKEA